MVAAEDLGFPGFDQRGCDILGDLYLFGIAAAGLGIGEFKGIHPGATCGKKKLVFALPRGATPAVAVVGVVGQRRVQHGEGIPAVQHFFADEGELGFFEGCGHEDRVLCGASIFHIGDDDSVEASGIHLWGKGVGVCCNAPALFGFPGEGEAGTGGGCACIEAYAGVFAGEHALEARFCNGSDSIHGHHRAVQGGAAVAQGAHHEAPGSGAQGQHAGRGTAVDGQPVGGAPLVGKPHGRGIAIAQSQHFAGTGERLVGPGVGGGREGVGYHFEKSGIPTAVAQVPSDEHIASRAVYRKDSAGIPGGRRLCKFCPLIAHTGRGAVDPQEGGIFSAAREGIYTRDGDIGRRQVGQYGDCGLGSAEQVLHALEYPELVASRRADAEGGVLSEEGAVGAGPAEVDEAAGPGAGTVEYDFLPIAGDGLRGAYCHLRVQHDKGQ